MWTLTASLATYSKSVRCFPETIGLFLKLFQRRVQLKQGFLVDLTISALAQLWVRLDESSVVLEELLLVDAPRRATLPRLLTAPESNPANAPSARVPSPCRRRGRGCRGRAGIRRLAGGRASGPALLRRKSCPLGVCCGGVWV